MSWIKIIKLNGFKKIFLYFATLGTNVAIFTSYTLVNAVDYDPSNSATSSSNAIVGGSGGGVQIKNPLDLANLAELVTRFTSLIIPISVIGFVFCVIYAGYTRMYSGANTQNEQKSMKIATNAAIGFALIFLANAFVYLISSVLGFSFKLT